MITIGHIINAVHIETGYAPEMLRGPRRCRQLAWARQYAFLLAYELCQQSSMVMIGRAFNRDHTTVLWGLKQARKRLRADPSLERWLDGIQRRLKMRFPENGVRRMTFNPTESEVVSGHLSTVG